MPRLRRVQHHAALVDGLEREPDVRGDLCEEARVRVLIRVERLLAVDDDERAGRVIGFGEGPLEDSRPPRFANKVGLVFLTAASIAYVVRGPAESRLDVAAVANPAQVTTLRTGPERIDAPAFAPGKAVGVLVQCNYGARRELRVAGVPVGEEITDLIAYLDASASFTAHHAANVAKVENGHRIGKLVEFSPTEKIFTNPEDERTKEYVTGKFG